MNASRTSAARNPLSIMLTAAAALAVMTACLVAYQHKHATMIGAAALGALFVMVVLRWPSVGTIAGLLLATVGAAFLRRFQIFQSGTAEVKLAGVVVLAELALSLSAIVLHRRYVRQGLGILTRSRGAGLFVAFLALNLPAMALGIWRYDLAHALADGDWLVWPGFAIIVVSVGTERLVKTLGLTAYGASMYHCVRGTLQFLAGSGRRLTTGGARYIDGSTSLLVAAGVIISLVLIAYFARTWCARVLLAGTTLFQLWGVVLSFNRQTWVALSVAIALGFLVLLWRRLKRLIGPAVLVCTVAMVALSLVASDRLAAMATSLGRRVGQGQLEMLFEDPSVQFRFAAWRTAVSSIVEQPLLGQGWGTPFRFTYIVPKTEQVQSFDVSPHNTYLWLAFKAGIPVMCLFFWGMAVLLVRAVRLTRRLARSDPAAAACLLAAALIQIIYLIGALWWDYLTVMYMSVPIWLNAGVLILLTTVRLRAPSSGCVDTNGDT